MTPVLRPNFSTVTEQPGQLASRSQLQMMAARYAWAGGLALDKDLLEVACGAGMGLAALARSARWVEAVDVDDRNLGLARANCAHLPNVHLRRAQAEDLPYAEASFDLVVLFEALYYLSDPWRFFRQAHRVLRPGGRLLISTVNREWTGFNPSPFHTRYLSAAELGRGLAECGFEVGLEAGFPEGRGALAGLVGSLRGAAVRLGWMPRTMRGKAFLKRVFYGRLEPIPSQLDPNRYRWPKFAPFDPVTGDGFRVLYAEARKI